MKQAQAYSIVTRLAVLWKNKAVSFPIKIDHYKSLVLSVLCYGWAVNLERETCHWKQMLNDSRVCSTYHRESTKQERVWQQVNILTRRLELLLSTIRCRKLSWFGHICRHDILPKITLQGTVDGIHCREKKCLNHERTTLRPDQSMSSLLCVWDDRSR